MLVQEAGEGLIVRKDGRELRVRRWKNATFKVSSGVARDADNRLQIQCNLLDGLYDFKYEKGNWVYEKPRYDKFRPDTYGGIKQVLEDTVVLGEFIKNVPILRGNRKQIPEYIRVAPLVGTEDDRKAILSMTDHCVYVRGTGLSGDSLRANILLLQSEMYLVSADIPREGRLVHRQFIMNCEKNEFVCSGQLCKIPCHKTNIRVKIKDKYYTSNPSDGKGNVKYFYISKPLMGAIVREGRLCFRLYEIKI